MTSLYSRKCLIIGIGILLLATFVVYGASPKAVAVVKDVSLNKTGQSLEVTITATEESKFTSFELNKPHRLVVDFPGIQNGLHFKEKQVAASGVERIRTSLFTSGERQATRIVFDLAENTHYQVTSEGSRVRVLFGAGPEKSPAQAVAQAAAPLAVPSPATSSPAEPAVAEPAAPIAAQPLVAEPAKEAPVLAAESVTPQPLTPATSLAAALTSVQPTQQITIAPPPPSSPVTAPAQPQRYTGELTSWDLKDVDVKDFFRLLGDISGLNIVLDPNVSGNLTLLLKDVPWDQALDIVLQNHQLGGQLQGNVLRIATNGTLQNEENQRKALRDAKELAVDLATKMYQLNYTKAPAMALILRPMLSTRGTIIQDPRKNALIVSDIPAQFTKVDQTVKALDTPAPQVQIEARLLSANKSFSRELGNQLGFIFGNNSINKLTGGTRTGSPFVRTPPPSVTVGGGGLPLAVDLPAAGTSGLAFLMGAGTDIVLDEIITAAEASGTAKLISRPNVMTQNNQAATISQGTKIPVQTNVNNTISVQFLDFSLRLTVTPQITEAGTILLTVDVENSQPDFARSVNGVPSVATQQATTQVLIQDGGTAVIGGILVDTDSLNVRQVPGLGSVPLVGHLFKNTQTIKSTSELFFFITPRVKSPDTLELTAPGAPGAAPTGGE
jgi:type IV pilus assembly protein PilQ